MTNIAATPHVRFVVDNVEFYLPLAEANFELLASTERHLLRAARAMAAAGLGRHAINRVLRDSIVPILQEWHARSYRTLQNEISRDDGKLQ